jgi:TolB-like protein/Flp pilus assembly protein TadD
MSLFAELKRRNVFRVALLYLVASWLIIQVADVGISLLGLPLWAGRFVFLLLAIGFPLVVVFSWAYEITPEGLKKEKDVAKEESITHATARKLNMAVIVLLVLALGGMVADRLVPEQAAPVENSVDVTAESGPVMTGPSGQSIAVLPFVNMSADQDNEYFSDGLSEELLNLLAKIPELKVAARTSAFSFKGTDASIPEIANKLNVAHVLEGSVRKSGEEIRITAQLIKAADGYHLWSETWDRTLVDVFAIQDEIAEKVVAALKITLLGEVPHARVTDPHAYELYLQAKALADISSEESLKDAARLLEEALAIDSEYAEAWTELSTVQTNRTGLGYLPQTEGFASAAVAARRALAINPRDARALSGLGWNAMYRDWDFAEASRLIEEALKWEPGNASVINVSAVLNGVFGRRERMMSLYESALERDPVAMSVLGNLSGAYLGSGRVEDAAILIERMREVSPTSDFVGFYTAWLHWYRGEAEAALDAFMTFGGSAGNWGRVLSLYDLGRDDDLPGAIQDLIDGGGRPMMLAVVYAYLGDDDKAFEWLDRGYEERDDWLIEIRMYSQFEGLYDDPRWNRLLTKIGISDADAEAIGF